MLTFKARRQRGFTLLEVLVALIILSVGLLGVATLQAQGVRYNYSSALRTQANELAYDIIDRLRANRVWGADATALSFLQSNYQTGIGDSVTATVDCLTAACTDAELAAWDLVQWKARLSDTRLGLPSGDGAVDIALVNVPTTRVGVTLNEVNVTVTVQWIDDRDNASVPFQFQLQSKL